MFVYFTKFISRVLNVFQENALNFSSFNASLRIEKTKQCKIIQGLSALFAQSTLLIVVLTVLLIKRLTERPRRLWSTWFLDISKQGCSALTGHFCGLGMALLAHHKAKGTSECGWYFNVYLFECTLGIVLAIFFHKAMIRTAQLHLAHLVKSARPLACYNDHWTTLFIESGNYGDPPNYKKWIIQVIGWVICVFISRLTVGMTVVLGIPILEKAAKCLDRWFDGHPDLYLFTVMVGCPMILNVGQAWIQDQVLKWKIKLHHHPEGWLEEERLLPADSTSVPLIVPYFSECIDEELSQCK
uniref:Uncharacterized protein n=1 Tax=Polytomella parva TaxID=51329 RepID=A0A7S0Y9J2_9CHLO|mmetsp:Transcript_11218/g.20312  ORF Transcript_11218/g.20312 Transcript_11218/m.20312 type:complete len:299 (+) Transcript_11218:181-1077(+)